MARLCHSYLELLSHNEAEYQLQLFLHVWDNALQSVAAEALSVYKPKDPPASQLDSNDEQHPDDIILEANRSFLKSLKSLRDTNQSYLEISQQGSAVLYPSRDVVSRLPPTPRIPQLALRRPRNARDGKENPDPREIPDADACAEKLRSIGLNSR